MAEPSSSLEQILREHSLKAEQLNIPCIRKHAEKVAQKLEDWEPLAPELGLSGEGITSSSDLLAKWMEKCGKATYLKLAEGLEKIKRLDLVEELSLMIVPHVRAKEIVDELVQTLEQNFHDFNISEIIEGGSFGHGTAVFTEYDIDLVLYSTGITEEEVYQEGGNCRKWLTKLNTFLGATFKDNYVQTKEMSNRCLQFRFRDTMDVDLLVSPFWPSDEPQDQDQSCTTLYNYLESIRGKKRKRKRQNFTACASKWQVEFFKDQPQKVKELIRKAKEWRNEQWPEDESRAGRPSSYLMSLLVIAAYEQDPNDVTGAIKKLVLQKKKKKTKKLKIEKIIDGIDLCWEKFYKRRDYPSLLPPRPRVVDPANPANNLWVSGFLDCPPKEKPNYYEPGPGNGNCRILQERINTISL